MAIEHLREANRKRSDETRKRNLEILKMMESRAPEILTATQIGEEFCISPKTVNFALRDLHKLGLLKFVRGKRGGRFRVPLSHPAKEWIQTSVDAAIEAKKMRASKREHRKLPDRNTNAWICQMFPEFEGKDPGEVLYERYGCSLIDFNHITRPKRRARGAHINGGDGSKATNER